MPISVTQADRNEGSWLLRGVQSRRDSRALRSMVVEGLANDRTALSEANAHIETNYATHPDDSTLPLASVRSTYWTPGVTMSEAVYAHTRYSNPTGDAFALARSDWFGMRKAELAKRYYRDSSGTLKKAIINDRQDHVWTNDGTDPETVSVSTLKKDVAVWQLTVNAGILASDPTATVDDLQDAHNSDAVIIGDTVRPAGTLKFVGARVEPVHLPGGTIKYSTHYIFHWCSRGWGDYDVHRGIVRYLEGSAEVTGAMQYLVLWDDPFPMQTFAGAFPTYNGTDPTAATSSTNTVGSLGGIIAL